MPLSVTVGDLSTRADPTGTRTLNLDIGAIVRNKEQSRTRVNAHVGCFRHVPDDFADHLVVDIIVMRSVC